MSSKCRMRTQSKKWFLDSRRGVSEGLPDIVLMDDYDVQSYLTNYEGKFAELSDTIDFADFAEYKVENATYKEGNLCSPI